MTDKMGNKTPETGEKRARKRESASQTEENESCSSCGNMADIIAKMNHKLGFLVSHFAE